MDSSTNSTVEIEILDFWTCLFLDPPSGPPSVIPTTHFTSITTTTPANDSSLNESIALIFYECRAYGKYLSGNEPTSFIQNGHYLCVSIALITFLVGILGVVTNTLNILVLRKSHKGSTLKDLLVILAVVEWVACCSALVFSYLIVSILENINRSKAVYQWFRVANIIYSLSRTGSIYVTILVTIERYLVVAFPVQSKSWLTPSRSRFQLFLVALLTVVLNISLIFNAAVSTVEDNDIFPPNTHVENFPYIFKDTHFTNLEIQEAFTVLNYVAPFPLLLLSNIVLYKSIYEWTKSRVRLTGTQKREMNATKMFSLVVLILLACHLMACVVFFQTRFQKLIYRELVLLQIFCVVLGASANFLIYLTFSRSFKVEFNNLLTSMNHHKFCTFQI